MSFLNTQNLPAGHRTAVELGDAFKDGEILYLIVSNNEVIFLRKEVWNVGDCLDEDEPGFTLEQFILPRSAISWLVDIIENKFWKKPSQGGAPADVLHYEHIFDDEDIEIRFTPNCLKEFESGVSIINYSRPHGRLKFSRFAIPYHTLREKKLLQMMKSI
ncbi:hypothetical protein [Thalassomonas actiniarum]|uniref:Uncharacterized protein n=1 Tax=Thalassomonas actiniarum TaxID=485447 RepID=A0AAE9YLR3_9GAMM|nr:hypothetical protein [Thalassomonas actiniarum]WDD96958.1 hypothetical protein SG35_016515 [Thalassomonas actiniarum]